MEDLSSETDQPSGKRKRNDLYLRRVVEIFVFSDDGDKLLRPTLFVKAKVKEHMESKTATAVTKKRLNSTSTTNEEPRRPKEEPQRPEVISKAAVAEMEKKMSAKGVDLLEKVMAADMRRPLNGMLADFENLSLKDTSSSNFRMVFESGSADKFKQGHTDVLVAEAIALAL
ncbi:hypothetical protein ACLB2K_037656 [Fragaria x ananassa]